MLRLVVYIVQDHAVLNIRAVADDDFAHVAAQHGALYQIDRQQSRPMVAIAQNDGCLRQKRITLITGVCPHLFLIKAIVLYI